MSYFKETFIQGYDDNNILQNVSVEHNGLAVNQTVVAVDSNSSTANLTSGASFIGTSASTLSFNSIQVSLKTDQNCTIYIEQSPDGNNWDIVDVYEYYISVNNFGVTVQAINSYFRVRVVNNGIISTTYFRLQSVLCPIADPLPRSLDENGYLKTSVYKIEDEYGFEIENTPMNEMRVVQPYRLVGANFNGYVLDENFWTFTSGIGASATPDGAQIILSTGTTVNNSCSLQSVRTSRYVGGSSNRFRAVINAADNGIANNVRKVGMFNTTDGAYYQLSGTEFSINTMKGGVVTKVANGSFNGQYGSQYVLTTQIKTYEIYITNSKVIFSLNGRLLHTVIANQTTWTNTLNLPIRFENNNINGSTTNVSFNIYTATIHRLGLALTQPISKYQSGQVAALVLKYGAGTLHNMTISGVTNNSVVTLYDNTTNSGTILFSTGSMGAITTPFSLDFKGLPFFTGLTLAITAANSNATIVYE